MQDIKAAVVKKSGIKFVFVDVGRFDPMTGNMRVSADTRETLSKKYPGLPVLFRATSMIGNAPVYSGETGLVEYVRGVNPDAFKWKTLSFAGEK